jgi:hypothetical protein
MFSSTDTEVPSSMPTPTFLYRVDTMSMMPPGGIRRIDQKLIHPSAWKYGILGSWPLKNIGQMSMMSSFLYEPLVPKTYEISVRA